MRFWPLIVAMAVGCGAAPKTVSRAPEPTSPVQQARPPVATPAPAPVARPTPTGPPPNCHSRAEPGEGNVNGSFGGPGLPGGGGHAGPFCNIPALWVRGPLEPASDLDREQLEPFLRGIRKPVVRCYQEQTDGSVSGTITVTFAIVASGRVSSARGEGMNNPGLATCVADVIGAARFPKRKAVLEATVTVELEPNGGRPEDVLGE